MSEKEKTYKNSATTLSGRLKKDNPFSVPDGYFDTLPLKVSERVKSQESPGIFRMFFFKPAFGYSSFGIAALVLVFFFVLSYNENKTGSDLPDVTLTEVLVEYPDFLNSFDENDFFDIVLSGSGDDLFIIPETDISDDDIIEYLSDENDFDEDILLN